MAWIESHETLPTHPKTKRMCRMLKIPPVIAIGHLHFLWWWAMNHAQDGILDRYTPDDIADACAWDGDADQFLESLVTSGFIDTTSTGYTIHDWYDYAGRLISLRQKDAERKRNSRGKKPESKINPVDIQRTSEGHLPESIRDLDLNPNLNQNLKEKENTAHSPFNDPIKDRIYQFAIKCEIKNLSILVAETDLFFFIDKMEVEVIEEALKKAAGKKFGYAQTILTEWWNEGKTTIAHFRQRQPQRSFAIDTSRTHTGKHKLEVVKDNDPAPEVTPEELERMLERARKLKGESA